MGGVGFVIFLMYFGFSRYCRVNRNLHFVGLFNFNHVPLCVHVFCKHIVQFAALHCLLTWISIVSLLALLLYTIQCHCSCSCLYCFPVFSAFNDLLHVLVSNPLLCTIALVIVHSVICFLIPFLILFSTLQGVLCVHCYGG